MTLRVYKNEYKAAHLEYLLKAFTVESETEQVLIISGEPSELEKVTMGMYTTDEQFKSLFPDFLTVEERKENTRQEMQHIADEMRDTLLRIIENGIIGKDFVELRKMYLELRNRK